MPPTHKGSSEKQKPSAYRTLTSLLSGRLGVAIGLTLGVAGCAVPVDETDYGEDTGAYDDEDSGDLTVLASSRSNRCVGLISQSPHHVSWLALSFAAQGHRIVPATKRVASGG